MGRFVAENRTAVGRGLDWDRDQDELMRSTLQLSCQMREKQVAPTGKSESCN